MSCMTKISCRRFSIACSNADVGTARGPSIRTPCRAKTRPGAKCRQIVSDARKQPANLETSRLAATRFRHGPAAAPDRLPVLLVSGWVNRQQQAVIDYLLEENRILRAAHAPRRLRLTDDQRRRLAVKGSAAVFTDILVFRARVLATQCGKGTAGPIRETVCGIFSVDANGPVHSRWRASRLAVDGWLPS